MPRNSAGSGVKSYTIGTKTEAKLEIKLETDRSDGSVYVQMRNVDDDGEWCDREWCNILHFTRDGKLARIEIGDAELGVKTIEKAGSEVMLLLKEPESA